MAGPFVVASWTWMGLLSRSAAEGLMSPLAMHGRVVWRARRCTVCGAGWPYLQDQSGRGAAVVTEKLGTETL